LTATRLYQHLAGQLTMGTYVIDEYGACRFAVFDGDQPESLSVLADLHLQLQRGGINSWLELSRRGGHLWVLFERASPAAVRRWLLPLCPAGIEFYPKQDAASSDHPGSLIRVPFGLHRLTGERYPFLQCRDGQWEQVMTSWLDLFAWCAALAQLRSSQFVPAQPIPIPTPTKKTYPSILSPDETSDQDQTIRTWCAAYDPLEVIGRYVELDRRGLGCCPFGSHHSDGVDSHPSFRVYRPVPPNIRCWYCHTWKQGGSLFDFFRYYYGLSARDLWIAIGQGARIW
jgi:hypothetical protein